MTRPLLVLVVAASLVFPAAAGAAPSPLDTAYATGSSAFIPPQFPHVPTLQFREIQISAQSGASGQNASGAASFRFGPLHLFGPVTCLRVTGPGRGAGTAAAPTTAVLNFVAQSPEQFEGDVLTVELVDNGGNGQDVFSAAPDRTGTRAPTDCTTPFIRDPSSTALLTFGRAIVFDAPPLPTSTDQCKNGGWRAFGAFKNQGDCVSWVATGGKNPPAG